MWIVDLCIFFLGAAITSLIAPLSETIASICVLCTALACLLAGIVIRVRLLPLRETIQYKNDWQRTTVKIFFAGIPINIVGIVFILALAIQDCAAG